MVVVLYVSKYHSSMFLLIIAKQLIYIVVATFIRDVKVW